MNSGKTGRLSLAAGLLFLAHSTVFGGATFYTLLNNGPATNRLNIVFMSEGYTSNDLARFPADALNALNTLLAAEPYSEYSNYLNAFAIAVPSIEPGSDHPVSGLAGSRNTYFNSTYDSESDRLITIPAGSSGQGKVDALLNTFMPNCQLPILLVNDIVPGGSDGFFKTAIASVSANPSVFDILTHETGHVLAGLGDEYTSPYPGFPDTEEPNTTKATQLSVIKWNAWIAPGTPIPTPTGDSSVIGLFQGAHYHTDGWYRPKLECKMKSIGGVPFCEVCREAMTLAFYRHVRPVDRRSPANPAVSAASQASLTFSVSLLQPATHSLAVQWQLDGQPLAGATDTSLTLAPSDGAHVVKAIVKDPTSFVRTDTAGVTTQAVSWNVTVGGSAAGTYKIAVASSSASMGKVSGGGSFKSGSSRTVKATANNGYAFSNWTENGVVVSTAASYTFTVSGARNLTANFVSSPFSSFAGSYSGLFFNSTNVTGAASGSFTVNVTTKGAYSGSLQVSGKKVSVSGQFDPDGNAVATPKTSGGAAVLTVAMRLDVFSGVHELSGMVSSAAGWSSQLLAYRAGNGALASAGHSYTMVFPGTSPAGDGYATVVVDKSGRVKMAGVLSDGAKLSQSAALSEYGDWPVFVPLYRNAGSLLGWLSLSTNLVTGDIAWLKSSASGTLISPVGELYSPNAANVLSFSSGTVALTGADLAAGLSGQFTLGSRGKVTPAVKTLSLSFTLSSGLFRGTIPDSSGKKISFNGVVLQSDNVGRGLFLHNNQSGEVQITGN